MGFFESRSEPGPDRGPGQSSDPLRATMIPTFREPRNRIILKLRHFLMGGAYKFSIIDGMLNGNDGTMTLWYFHTFTMEDS